MVFLTALAGRSAADIPPQDRAAIDGIIGSKGTYVSDEGTYKIVLPREAATIVQDYQKLSPNIGLNSWAAFSSAIHEPALLVGEFLLLDDEVNPVLSAALDAGLEVTGLAASSVFDGPRMHTLDVSGRGSFQTLAAAFRKGLDEIRRIGEASATLRTKSQYPSVRLDSAIDGRPLDTILSMRGSTVGGVYKAAIGKRAMIHGELVGREMGMTTWVSFSGADDHAVVQGEFVETADDLQKALKALRARGIYIESVRNHTAGEHPQFIFIRYWGEGSAVALARSIRYVLNVEIGVITPGAKL
jgi:hypothetical protein